MNILIISDTQAPGHHQDAIEFLNWVKSEYKPDRVVHIGDELDLHHLSKWVRNPNLPGATEEISKGLQFMAQLYKLFPKVDVCISNHTSRPYLRAQEAGLPSIFLRGYTEWMQAPKGWNWHSKIEIDDTVFIHGEGLSGDGARLKACTLLQKNCVFGHLHSNAGISWFSTKEKLLFGFNVGCLIDPRSTYFDYGKHHLMRPIIGCGVIRDGLPIFVPMILNKNNRWIGHKAGFEVKVPKIKLQTSGTNGRPNCPNCHSNIVKIHDHRPSRTRYRCKNCNIVF